MVLHSLIEVIHALPHGVLMEDKDGKIVIANGEFCRIFELDVDARVLAGQPGSHVSMKCAAGMADPSEFTTSGDACRARATQWIEEPFSTIDGQFIERRYIPIQPGTSGAAHLWLFRDVTRQKQREHQLLAAHDEAKTATQAKTVFLANMSHEIRTPMNGIIGMTEILMDTQLEFDQIEILETVHSCSKSLLEIINDILDLSKVEANEIQLESIEFSPRDCIDSVIRTVESLARDKGYPILTKVDRGVPSNIIADPLRLRQIVMNLVSNALKFTESGFIRISMDVDPPVENQSAGNHPRVLRVAVEDTGIGIPAEALGTLFEAFKQADSSTTRKYGGTGLGLALIRNFCELMNGKVHVESEPGDGSTFSFTIEFQDTQVEKTRIADEGLRPAMVGQAVIYDHNEANSEVLRGCLGSLGYECRFAQTKKSAVGWAEWMLKNKAAESSKNFVLFIDQETAKQDGLKLSDLNTLAGSSIGLVLIGGSDPGTSKFDFSWVENRITRPIDHAKLENLLSERTNLRNQTLASGVVAEPEAEKISLRVLLAEDNKVNQRVASRVLKKLGHRVTVVSDGLLAIDAVKSTPFDVILMDCRMPNLDGFEATEQIRALKEPFAKTPIIALTASAMKEERDRCMEVGMDDFLSKPIDRALLTKMLDKIGQNSTPNANDDDSSTNESAQRPPLAKRLLEEGHVTARQLITAMEYQIKSRPMLGRIALEQGMLSENQVLQIMKTTAETNRRFGAAGRALGLLSLTDVANLLEEQKQQSPSIETILVEMGYIDASKLHSLVSMKKAA